MRRACGLSVAAGGVLAAVVAAQPAKLPAPTPAPLPGVTTADPARLKADVEALAKERADALKVVPGGAQTAAEREVLQRQLLEILKRIESRPPTAPFPKNVAPPPGGKGFELPTDLKAVDRVKAGENLYRAGEYDAALRVFRDVDRSLLAREDRAFAHYMLACSYRKTGRRTEAAQLYREVAEARDDEFLSECAIWQLSLIRNTTELEAQLEQLRSRPKSR